MVFPQDPEWQAAYNAAHGHAELALRHVRFRSWGTEELLVRCAQKFMPWLRRIHILLASPGQRQMWMDGPMLEVHYHRDFIPTEHLPCFTSPTIEMFLHRIPNLAEQFIYINDDMFPLSALEESDFFRDGLPCQHYEERPFPSQPNIFQRKCMNQQNMIAEPFGKHFARTWLKNGHSFAPILRSTCKEVWRIHGDKILQNISPVARTDHSYSHYIYPLYHHFLGRYVDHVPRQQYVGRSVPTSKIASIMRDSHAGIVCVNDNECIADWEQRAAIVRRELMTKLNP